jgi:transposase
VIEKHSGVLGAIVLPANMQDAYGARLLLPGIKERVPTITTILGDGAYRQGPLREFAANLGIHINADSPPLPDGKIFVPQPLRWRVERFFSWLFKWRRVAKNWCYSIWGYATDVSWAILGLAMKRAV